MRRRLLQLLPWAITLIGLYYAFRGVDWGELVSHLGEMDPVWIGAAFGLTVLSYLLRARRWQALFPQRIISFANAAKVLILGFFFNNILPARAGEFVRAHMGSKMTGETRTLVLATIASERLIDGLTISAMFLLFASGIGDSRMAANLEKVAALFFLAGISVVVVLYFRKSVFAFLDRVLVRYSYRALSWTSHRIQVFLNGLMPMVNRGKFPVLLLWSIVIWSVELAVYTAVGIAYGHEFSLAHAVLFLVAVNFASLIPAAPGGLGVIEAVGSAVLMSVGVPKELALTMVLTQHAIQILVVGIPGAWVTVTLKPPMSAAEVGESENGQSQGEPSSSNPTTVSVSRG